MENSRDQWGTKLGFILAAIGSAVGLGNIWRFPYVVYENGGGAYLIPYFVAIFTAGIPLLILEYGMGHKYKGSTPLALARANKKWEWLGWWPSITAFMILTYYTMILSCAIKYFTLSFTQGWGSDPNTYFFNDFLQSTTSPFQFKNIVWSILICITLLWLVNWFICFKGVKKGIEKLNKVLLPTLLLIMIVIVIKGVTLEGATLGLNKLFTPDWSKVMEPKVWLAAYGQVFYSLSLAMGIMMTYSSYLPRKTDINNSAIMTAFANCGFEFLCAIGVFAILGFMATSQGVPIDGVVSNGVGLAFIVFPKVFSIMGATGKVLGVLFFLCLIFAGLTSTVSLVEAVSSAIIDKTGWKRKKVVTGICIFGFAVSTIYATGAGILILDIVDAFLNNYSIVVVGLLEAVVIGWIIKTEKIRNHVNDISYYRIGKWWDFTVKYITPVMLTIMIVQNIINEIKKPYGNFSRIEIFAYGWASIALGIIAALIISTRPWKNKKIEKFEELEKEQSEVV